MCAGKLGSLGSYTGVKAQWHAGKNTQYTTTLMNFEDSRVIGFQVSFPVGASDTSLVNSTDKDSYSRTITNFPAFTDYTLKDTLSWYVCVLNITAACSRLHMHQLAHPNIHRQGSFMPAQNGRQSQGPAGGPTVRPKPCNFDRIDFVLIMVSTQGETQAHALSARPRLFFTPLVPRSGVFRCRACVHGDGRCWQSPRLFQGVVGRGGFCVDWGRRIRPGVGWHTQESAGQFLAHIYFASSRQSRSNSGHSRVWPTDTSVLQDIQDQRHYVDKDWLPGLL